MLGLNNDFKNLGHPICFQDLIEKKFSRESQQVHDDLYCHQDRVENWDLSRCCKKIFLIRLICHIFPMCFRGFS